MSRKFHLTNLKKSLKRRRHNNLINCIKGGGRHIDDVPPLRFMSVCGWFHSVNVNGRVATHLLSGPAIT